MCIRDRCWTGQWSHPHFQYQHMLDWPMISPTLSISTHVGPANDLTHTFNINTCWTGQWSHPHFQYQHMLNWTMISHTPISTNGTTFMTHQQMLIMVNDLTNLPYSQMLNCLMTWQTCQVICWTWQTCQIKYWTGKWPDTSAMSTNVELVQNLSNLPDQMLVRDLTHMPHQQMLDWSVT